MGRKQRYQKQGHWAGRPQLSPFCLSQSHRHCGRGLIVVIRVKSLAFPGDFCKPAPRESAAHEPPQVVMLLMQALRIIELSQLVGVILSKGQAGWRAGGQKSQTPRLILKFKVGGHLGARRWKQVGPGLGQNPCTFHLRYPTRGCGWEPRVKRLNVNTDFIPGLHLAS